MKELTTENQYLDIDRTEINELMKKYMSLDNVLYVQIREYSRTHPKIRDFGRILIYFKDEINIAYKNKSDS